MFAIPASGEADIAQLIGMPPKQSIIGEGYAFPAGMRSSVTSAIQGPFGLPALRWRLPRPSRSRLSGASDASPW